MGSGYVIEHCVSAFSERDKEKAFRIYVTDAIMCISETVATASKYGGSYMEKRYADIIEPQEEIEYDPDEIALDIITRAGLRVDNECIGVSSDTIA